LDHYKLIEKDQERISNVLTSKTSTFRSWISRAISLRKVNEIGLEKVETPKAKWMDYGWNIDVYEA
jgi:hypothetical protein